MNQKCDSNRSQNTQAWDQIDAVCERFEISWRESECPKAEEWVTQVPQPLQNELLGELLLIEIEYRRRKGESIMLPELQLRFPEKKQWLEQLLRDSRTNEQVLLPGEQLGRYRVRHAIEHGAFGSVYLARDEDLDRDVAIKVPRCHAQDLSAHDQLVHESKILASLSHPGILPVFDVGRLETGIPFVVLEFLAGGSLADRLKLGPLPWKQAVLWISQLGQAMHYVHVHGLIHRDFKPANILIDEKQQVRISDFGLAFFVPSVTSVAKGVAGTPCYMAPEQLADDSEANVSADIWSLGMVFYEMLTGRRPFTRNQIESLVESETSVQLPPPSSLHPAIPASVDAICLKCLKPKAADRFPSVGHFVESIQKRVLKKPLISRRQVIAATAVAAATGGAAWQFARKFFPAATPDLQTNLNVLAWSEDRGIRWVTHAEALPVQPGESIRIHATLSRPAFAYLVWIDSQANVLPLFPGAEGRWEWCGTEIDSVSEISLPHQAKQGWVMEVDRPGMETLLLLVAEKRLSKSQLEQVQRACSNWLPQPPTKQPAIFHFHNGRLDLENSSQMRSPNLSPASPLKHALFQNQHRLFAKTQGLFVEVSSLTFSCGTLDKKARTPAT